MTLPACLQASSYGKMMPAPLKKGCSVELAAESDLSVLKTPRQRQWTDDAPKADASRFNCRAHDAPWQPNFFACNQTHSTLTHQRITLAHIPKTGGTTMAQLVKAHVVRLRGNGTRTVSTIKLEHVQQWLDSPNEVRRNTWLIEGKRAASTEGEQGEGRVLAMMFRHPVERMLSHFDYMRAGKWWCVCRPASYFTPAPRNSPACSAAGSPAAAPSDETRRLQNGIDGTIITTLM